MIGYAARPVTCVQLLTTDGCLCDDVCMPASVSEKWHSVEVVKSGTRRTLVTELWAGGRCLYDRDN
jgi:hypothetical protein